MREKPFEPSSVTKPIQLLAAWLIGLIAVNGSFLAAAAAIREPSWAPGFLIICAAADVPIFLGALFLLQTKFRPEMQEDTFYSKYLERRSSETMTTEIFRVDVEKVADEAPSRIVENSVSKKFLFKRKSGVQVNNLLPEFNSIMATLDRSGIKVSNIFGSTSKNPETPARKIISFGLEADLNLVRKVIRVMLPFHFDEISIADEPYHGSNIYIGSYVYRVDPDKPKKLTPELRERLLSEDLTQDDMFDLLS